MSAQKFLQPRSRVGPTDLPDGSLNDVPVNLLESFLPGFGIIRRLIVASVGFDITLLVSTCFIAFAVLTSVRYIWRAAAWEVMKWFTSTIEIQSRDRLHEQFMYWVSKQQVTETARRLTAKTRGSEWEELDGQIGPRALAEEPFNFSDWDSSIPPIYAPSFGSHWFIHRGTLFFFRRDQGNRYQNAPPPPDTEEDREIIRISCLGRSTEPIKQLLHACKVAYTDSKRALTMIYHPGFRGNWHSATTRPSRPMNTVYLESDSKEKLIADARDFLHPLAPKFYARRGIPYRRGYLLYGQPGTGKTSISLALAGMFGLELYVLSLSEPSMTDARLGNLFANLSARCVVLLEDVDAMGLNNRKLGQDAPSDEQPSKPDKPAASEKTSVTLSGLLNAIDGVASQEGRILVMTTNDPDALDKALVRPGRVDLQIYFGNVNKTNARQIFERMYAPDEDEEAILSSYAPENRAAGEKHIESEKLKLQDMASEFADAIPEDAFTPAEVQGFLLTRRKDPSKALEEVVPWREELLAAKASGKSLFKSEKKPQINGDLTAEAEVGPKALYNGI